MIRAAQPPAAAKARDTRSPSRRLPRAEKRTRRQQGDTLYHGRLDGRNLAETHGRVELSTTRSTTASGGTRTPAALHPTRRVPTPRARLNVPQDVRTKNGQLQIVRTSLGANLARCAHNPTPVIFKTVITVDSLSYQVQLCSSWRPVVRDAISTLQMMRDL